MPAIDAADPKPSEDLSVLSDGQRVVWEPFAASGLKHEQVTERNDLFREVGAQLGISVAAVYDRYQKARRKLGLPDKPGNGNGRPKPRKRTEYRNPEAAAQVLLAAADPTDERKRADVERDTGLDKAVQKSIESRLQPLAEETTAIMVEKLRPALGLRMSQIINSMDEKTMAKASLQQKAISFGILFDKDQLLQSKPTQIIQTQEDREAAPAAAKLLVEELNRRGMTVNLDPIAQTLDVTPAAPRVKANGRFVDS